MTAYKQIMPRLTTAVLGCAHTNTNTNAIHSCQFVRTPKHKNTVDENTDTNSFVSFVIIRTN